MNKLYFRLFFQRTEGMPDSEKAQSILKKLSLYGCINEILEDEIYWKFPDLYALRGLLELGEEWNFTKLMNYLSQEWDMVEINEAIWNKDTKLKQDFILDPFIRWLHIEDLA